jgi:hypothetical protein
MDWGVNAVENRLTTAHLHTKELIKLVDFGPNVFLGFERHKHKLAMFCRVQHLTKLVILDGETFNVLHKTFHTDSFFAKVIR